MRFRTEKDKQVWQQALDTAEEQWTAHKVRLDGLDTERAEIVEDMGRLERLMSMIQPLTTDHPLDQINDFIDNFTPDPDSGLADAVIKVLYQAQRYMTPIEIRDVLEASKYDLTQHSNALASIHGVLKRFEEGGRVTSVPVGNKTAYRLQAHDRGVTGSVRVKTPPRWSRVPTEEEAMESARKRAAARAAMERAKGSNTPTIRISPETIRKSKEALKKKD